MGGLANSRLRSAQAGISLVETLVALVLGLTMVSVALDLQTSNRAVSGQIQAMVRLQESAGIAAALLETNLRHAGGTLCRNNPPTTTLLDTPSLASYWDYRLHTPAKPYAYWEYIDGGGLLGIHGYESTTSDPIVGDNRKAGDSISIMSDNMGAVARVTGPATHTSQPGTFGFTGTYTFPVDKGLNFPVGTVAMVCDYTRAVLFQVTASNASTITLQAGGGTPPSPGNCSVTMRRVKLLTDPVSALDGNFSCTKKGQNLLPQQGQIYAFGPGSMIGEHTFHHWYIGRKTGTSDGLSLYRRSMGYDGSGNVELSAAQEIVQNVTDMQITYLSGLLGTGYPAQARYKTADEINSQASYVQRGVTAVRILLTVTSPEKVGLAATDTATAATYTIPINVTIRARMPGVVRR